MSRKSKETSPLVLSGERIFREAGSVDLGQFHQFELIKMVRFPRWVGLERALHLKTPITTQKKVLDAFWYGTSTGLLRPDFSGHINLVEYEVVASDEPQRLAMLDICVDEPWTARTKRQLHVFRLGDIVLKSIYDPSLGENSVDYVFRIGNEGATIKLGSLMCKINEYLAQSEVEGYAPTTQFMAEALHACLDI